MTIEQRSGLEREDRRHESTQAHLTGRLKSACCWYCGTADGMQSIRREILADAGERTIALWDVKWHKKPGNDEQLFYACRDCNKSRNIPDGFELMSMANVVTWLDRDPMQPDYEEMNNE